MIGTSCKPVICYLELMQILCLRLNATINQIVLLISAGLQDPPESASLLLLCIPLGLIIRVLRNVPCKRPQLLLGSTTRAKFPGPSAEEYPLGPLPGLDAGEE